MDFEMLQGAVALVAMIGLTGKAAQLFISGRFAHKLQFKVTKNDFAEIKRRYFKMSKKTFDNIRKKIVEIEKLPIEKKILLIPEDKLDFLLNNLNENELSSIDNSKKIEILVKSSLAKRKKLLSLEEFKGSLMNLPKQSRFSVIEKMLIHNKISYAESLIFLLEDIELEYFQIMEIYNRYGKNQISSAMLKKYRKKIKSEDNLKEITVIEILGEIEKYSFDEIVSENYLKIAAYIKNKLESKQIDKNNYIYLKAKEVFEQSIAKEIDIDKKDIDTLFFRFLSGNDVFNLKNIDSREKAQMLLTSRGKIELGDLSSALTFEQMQNINMKHVTKLKEIFYSEYVDVNQTQENDLLILQIYSSIGFDKAEELLLGKEVKLTHDELKRSFGKFIINKVKFSKSGPNYDNKFVNFLFGGNSKKLKNIHKNKIGNISATLSHVYNEFKTLEYVTVGKITNKTVLEYIKRRKIILPPDEKKLEKTLPMIGTTKILVKKARQIMKKAEARKASSIPKVEGEHANYTYEILDLDDPRVLAVGNLTHCCFNLKGNAKSSVVHAATSKNGRIFVVRKNNEIIAQSWVWRRGNLVCFDNIEIIGVSATGNLKDEKLLNCYKKASSKMISASKTYEDDNSRIKMCSVGEGSTDLEINAPLLNKKILPQKEKRGKLYTDAKTQKILLDVFETEDYKLNLDKVDAIYKDSKVKNASLVVNNQNKEFANEMVNKINYIKYKNENPKDKNGVGYNYINVKLNDEIAYDSENFAIKRDGKIVYSNQNINLKEEEVNYAIR